VAPFLVFHRGHYPECSKFWALHLSRQLSQGSGLRGVGKLRGVLAIGVRIDLSELCREDRGLLVIGGAGGPEPVAVPVVDRLGQLTPALGP